jgi:hypothetical protein
MQKNEILVTKDESIIEKIRSVLLGNHFINVSKAKDYSSLGLHWYKFSGVDPSTGYYVKGSGASFNDELSIKKAWGEFVERYSFFKTDVASKNHRNSSGFASHLSIEKAHETSFAELVERDIFLFCWMLKIPAIRLKSFQLLLRNLWSWHCANVLRKMGVFVEIGIFGECMDFIVGASFIHDSNKFAVFPASNRTLSGLLEKLITEAVVTASDWRSPDAQEPIEMIPIKPRPIDHLKFYLKTGKQLVPPFFLADSIKKTRIFPKFSFENLDLTQENNLAVSTNYYISRSVSAECQRLWFGPTTPEVVNLDRLSEISGKRIKYEDVNKMVHPLP